MEYVSTRGSAPALDFEGANLAGLASDGGLYVPREWPCFAEAEIAAMAGLPYAELAARVLAEGVLISTMGRYRARACTHLDVNRAQIDEAAAAIRRAVLAH